MRACLQRVSEASVIVDGRQVGCIGQGMLVLLGVADDDQPADVRWLADKICELRIFEDDQGKMNRSLLDVGGELLVVSQFTLLGDCRKGGVVRASSRRLPPRAEALYDTLVAIVGSRGIRVATGTFRAHMDVRLVNDGPVTLLLDSRKAF